MKIPVATRQTQLLATDPSASAFVSANAGSGKTWVLTRRVIRLLLDGVDPGRILCLTFTKAAAAEMSARIFDELGRWAGLTDDELTSILSELEGRPVHPDRLAPARRLFARAIETPGGLKIQTIHAFAEALLQRFPIEAGLDGRFRVLDDARSADLYAEARAELLSACAAHPDSPEGRALSELVAIAGDETLDRALRAVVSARDDLAAFFNGNLSIDEALAALPQALGAPAGASWESLIAEMAVSPDFSGPFLSRLIDSIDASKSKSMPALGDGFRAALAAPDPETRRLLWRGLFLTGKGEPRKRPFTKDVLDALPEANERFEREAQRLLNLERALSATLWGTRSAALLRLADRLIGLIEAKKARLGLLDFDDLIERAAALLSRSDATEWVQYKLDEGLDHVLVDEAQDTSPRQWQIVGALTGEFSAGEGARAGRRRTIFAVGDEKQSIYSFQGAAPHLFGLTRQTLGRRLADAGLPVHDLRLTLSFRSTAAVVGAVDAVFRNPGAHAGLSTDVGPTVHETVRGREPGLVELWPAVEKLPAPPPGNWEDPVDATAAASPAVRLAARIADEIAGWLRSGTRLDATGAPIRPGDVLVLVRKRGTFVEAVNRALKQRGVAVAGADRLDVVGHVVTQDLLAAARVALMPEDDLTLATVAKSPLIGLSEEALFRLARGRPALLWDAVRQKATEGDADAETLRATVALWMSRADRGEPFVFLSRLVGPDGGRAAYRARFGREADEVIDELLTLALAYEGEETAGLNGFIDRLAKGGELIRRELDAERDEVRVMTVHGSKGLEAPVVFLIDPGDKPASEKNLPDILAVSDGPNPPIVWRQGGAFRPAPVEAAAQAFIAAQEEEYRRLLYVGLTRARDRLIVAGLKGADEGADRRWHGLVEAALGTDAETVRGPDGTVVAWRWHAANEEPPAPAQPARVSADETQPLPDWLTRKVTDAPAGPTSIAPSRAATSGQAGATTTTFDPRAAARGTILHRLFELLPDIEPAARAVAADAYLARLLPDLPGGDRTALVEAIVALMARPDLTLLFSPAARAEAAIAGSVATPAGRTIAVSGSVDRLLVEPEAVMIVDYKTAARPPRSVPQRYLLQLALYRAVLRHLWPDRPVRAAILWTAAARFDEVAPATLDAALAAYLEAVDAGARPDDHENETDDRF
ncbi:double-strand break repair helicase AddA [Pleomorphomonas oryzae]|uniref:double-strand break repair helicase AddA n=1 Tax=Pleomorphomonas oryzae TaxID=261934 RepID=UPI000402C030|nr:double-strand break repair helicase AddA [Pleomorphomonas oryzae]